MNNKMSRRGLIAAAGCGLGVGAFVLGYASGEEMPEEKSQGKPRYFPVSPEAAAERAYQVYPEGACMYAVFRSVHSLIAEKDPVAAGPAYYEMFKYGHGGCSMHGSLCGACNGGAAIIGMYYTDKKVRDGIVAEYFRWYETTELPRYMPPGKEEFPASRSNSTLCHVSNHAWCEAADETMFTERRKERCRRLAADCTAQVVRILNAHHAGEAKPVAADEPKTLSCADCHSTPGGDTELEKEAPKTIARMECSVCHDHEMNHAE